MSDSHINYQEYLESYAWKALKKTKLEEQLQCESCGLPATSVHHLSYERLGREKPEDIVSICERCHEECHHAGGYQIKNDEEILRRRFEEVRSQYLGDFFMILKDGTKLLDLGGGILTDSKKLYYLKINFDRGEIECMIERGEEEYSQFKKSLVEKEEWGDGPENNGFYHPAYDGYGVSGDEEKYAEEEYDDFNYKSPTIKIGDEIQKTEILSKDNGTLYKTSLKESEYKKIDDNFTIIGNFVYYRNIFLRNLEGKSLNILSEDYVKDNNGVYKIWGYGGGYLPKIEGADTKSFLIIKDRIEYQWDENHLYKEGVIIDWANGKTFDFHDYIFATGRGFLYESKSDGKVYTDKEIRQLADKNYYPKLGI